MNDFLAASSRQGTRTGFFHLEQIAGRDMFIDPEGYGFLSMGINHVSPDLLFRGYNRHHSEKTYGQAPIDPDTGLFDMERFQQSDSRQVWLRTLRDDFHSLGCNTLGGLSSADVRPNDLPYTICLYFAPICHWTPVPQNQFPDVFDPRFERECDAFAEEKCAPLKDDPLLVGYFYIDCPILTGQSASPKYGNLYWDLVRGQTSSWSKTIQSLRGPLPGKKVYVELMKRRYGSIEAFNKVYGTNCERFSTLFRWDMSEVVPEDAREAAKDDSALLALILQKYYQVTHDAVKRHDPNHLILGDRYNGNTFVPDVAIEAMKPYVDVFSVQYYGIFEEQKDDLETWHRKSDKPLLLCDSCFSVVDENMPNPFGHHVQSQEERAEAYEGYARKVFEMPYIVGWHWCGYIDQWSAAQGKRQHSGIKDAWGNIHQPLGETMKRVNKNILQTM